MRVRTRAARKKAAVEDASAAESDPPVVDKGSEEGLYTPLQTQQLMGILQWLHVQQHQLHPDPNVVTPAKEDVTPCVEENNDVQPIEDDYTIHLSDVTTTVVTTETTTYTPTVTTNVESLCGSWEPGLGAVLEVQWVPYTTITTTIAVIPVTTTSSPLSPTTLDVVSTADVITIDDAAVDAIDVDKPPVKRGRKRTRAASVTQPPEEEEGSGEVVGKKRKARFKPPAKPRAKRGRPPKVKKGKKVKGEPDDEGEKVVVELDVDEPTATKEEPVDEDEKFVVDVDATVTNKDIDSTMTTTSIEVVRAVVESVGVDTDIPIEDLPRPVAESSSAKVEVDSTVDEKPFVKFKKPRKPRAKKAPKVVVTEEEYVAKRIEQRKRFGLRERPPTRFRACDVEEPTRSGGSRPRAREKVNMVEAVPPLPEFVVEVVGSTDPGHLCTRPFRDIRAGIQLKVEVSS